MNRRYYKKIPEQITTLEFLILNPDCPRSVINSLNQIEKHICTIDDKKMRDQTSASFLIGKMCAEYQFKTADEIQINVEKFIKSTLNNLVEISEKLEKEYFYY